MISSWWVAISAVLMPRIAPASPMLSRPLSSGWKPVPTCSRAPTRPRTVARPSVGAVTRDRIFISVVLPDPLRPTTPRMWPRGTEKVTSRSAQMDGSSRGPSARGRRMRPMRS